MTFGAKRFKQLQVGAVTLGAICVGPLIFPAILNGIQAPEAAHSKVTKEFTLEQLAVSLSLNPIHQVQFEEVYVSHFLTTPIKKSGRLSYTPPSRFEKHIATPTEESFVIDEDTVQYNNITQGENQSLSLQDVPTLQVLIVGLRSLFSGDLTTLHRYYQTELNGAHHQWALTMVPLDAGIQESVQFIRLRGMNSRIHEIEIQESNGDHSTLFLKEL
jgi:outer membrane lipoprotein-sorting protein